MKYPILTFLFLFCSTLSALAQDQFEIKDADANTLMRVEDEGNGGSVMLPDLTGAPALPENKLYNLGGHLYFNGMLVGGDHNQTFELDGDSLFLSDLNGTLGVDLSTLRSISEQGLTLDFCDQVPSMELGFYDDDEPVSYPLGSADQWQTFIPEFTGDIDFFCVASRPSCV